MKASSSSTSPAAAAPRCRSPCPICRRPRRPTRRRQHRRARPPGRRDRRHRPRAIAACSRRSGRAASGRLLPAGDRARFRPISRPTGAQNLVQGFVQANGNGSLTVGCYLYDVAAQTELTRQGYVVQPRDWRRAAHQCADTIYSRLTGEGAYFDTRIVYVSETGPARRRIKRLAIMDYDGANHRFLTNGQWTVLTPRFAPNQQTIIF